MAVMGGEERCLQVYVGKPEGNTLLGRQEREWEDNIQKYQTLWEEAVWINLAKDRETYWDIVKTVMNFRFHKIRGISWLVEELLAFQERLYSVGLV